MHLCIFRISYDVSVQNELSKDGKNPFQLDFSV